MVHGDYMCPLSNCTKVSVTIKCSSWLISGFAFISFVSFHVTSSCMKENKDIRSNFLQKWIIWINNLMFWINAFCFTLRHWDRLGNDFSGLKLVFFRASSTVNSFLMIRTISTALRSTCRRISIAITPFFARWCISISRSSTLVAFPRTCKTASFSTPVPIYLIVFIFVIAPTTSTFVLEKKGRRPNVCTLMITFSTSVLSLVNPAPLAAVSRICIAGFSSSEIRPGCRFWEEARSRLYNRTTYWKY